MSKSILLAILISVLFPFNVSASPLVAKKDNPIVSLISPPKKAKSKPKPKKKEDLPQPTQTHTTNAGETLTKIATKYNIPVKKVWSKNTHLSDPNLLKVGEKLAIPKPDETLPDRPLPTPPPVPAPSAPIESQAAPRPVAPTSENTYAPGNCTWYVKSLRADIPNTLGNAADWYSRAAALGYSVGATPRVGSIAWHGRGLGHVALVTAVAGNMVTITEMNHKGLYIINQRTVDASSFRYIY